MNDLHDKVGLNLKKAQSHLQKVVEMHEQKEYCIDIMQQTLAIMGLLKSAHQMLMEDHLNMCFSRAMDTTNERRKEEMVAEILKVTKLANKLSR